MPPVASTGCGDGGPAAGRRPARSGDRLRQSTAGRQRTLARRLGLLAWLAGLAAAAAGAPQEFLRIDFEDGRGPGLHPALSCPAGVRAEIVPGRDGQGRALRLSNSTPGAFCPLFVQGSFAVCRNLVLEFDHREEIEEGFEGAYLGVSLYGADGAQIAWTSDAFSPEWRHARVVIPLLQPMGDAGPMRPGLAIPRLQLYGRVREPPGVKGAARCRMTVWFDTILLHAPADVDGTGPARPYTCHNDPPLLDWAGPGAAGQILQLSREADFPPARTTAFPLETARPFFVPPEPLGPGTWYFRVRRETELLSGWSPAQTVLLPERTHRYRLRPIPFAALREASRPRLLRRLRPDAAPLAPADRERALSQARTALQEGVPEHPGPYVDGDPRWPQWIDWYGRVADGVTARTGSRLRTAAQAAMLTGHPEAVAAARSLLLAACGWDPGGGSAARHGDLQAASLLQGMVWCYDACAETLSPAEAERVLGVLRTRILQFYDHLSPFRLNPSQNHPWRQTEAVVEAALVLMGVLPEAEEWLDTACHAFAYRILPSMGFDGENQEGISYWAYGVDMLAEIADLLRFLAGVDVYDHPWLARTCRFPLYTTPPEGYSISFADNSDRGNASLRGPYGAGLVGLLGERVRDPFALWYADRSAPGLDARPPAELPQSVFYPHIGYVLFNTCLSDGLENVAVGLRCGPFHAGHQHDDNNGFVIHAYGDKLAVDGGYYDWYGSPHFKAYSIRTLAHNTLLVDGQCQVRETGGRITAYFDSPGFGWTVGDASEPAIYAGRLSRFDRRILFLKPGFVIVHDLVEASGAPARLDWLLHAHTQDPFPCDPATGGFAIERPAAALQGRLLAPAGVRLTVGRSFDVAPQQKRASVFLPWEEVQPEWTLTAGADPAARTEFLAVLAVHRRTGAGPVEPVPLRGFETASARGVECRPPYGRWLVLLRRQGSGGEPLEAEGLRADGQAAAVLLTPEGALANAFVAMGTRLVWQGRELFASPSPRSWALDEGLEPEPLTAALLLDGQPFAMQGLRRPLPGGGTSVWWATLELPEPRRCDLELEGWSGPRPPNVRLGGSTRTGLRQEVTLREGRSCVTVTGEGTFDRLVLRSRVTQVLDARRLAEAPVPGPRDVLVEGERPSAESERKGRVMEKVAASGGLAYCQIDGPVQWAEWSFDIPEAGAYGLLIRGCSEHPEAVRELRLDGQWFPAERTGVRMAGTGGWSRTADDWAWFEVMGAGGESAAAVLTAGPHVLRLEYVRGSQNVDALLLRRVPEPAAR